MPLQAGRRRVVCVRLGHTPQKQAPRTASNVLQGRRCRAQGPSPFQIVSLVLLVTLQPLRVQVNADVAPPGRFNRRKVQQRAMNVLQGHLPMVKLHERPRTNALGAKMILWLIGAVLEGAVPVCTRSAVNQPHSVPTATVEKVVLNVIMGGTSATTNAENVLAGLLAGGCFCWW